MKPRKIFALLLIVSLFLTACGNPGEGSDNGNTVGSLTETQTEEESARIEDTSGGSEPATEETGVETQAPDNIAETTTEKATEKTTEPEIPVIPQSPEFYSQKSDYVNEMLDNAIKLYSEKYGAEFLFDKTPPGRNEALQSKTVPVNKNPALTPSEYFKDIIILGDSVSSGFDLYRSSIKVNGEAVFRDLNVVYVISYGVYNATREVTEKSVHPKIDGVKMAPEDAISKYDASKVFINLGLNDAVWVKPNDFIKYYKTLTDRIIEKNPDKKIYIMSIPPLTKAGEKDEWTNEKIMLFNDMLIEFADENGFEFIDFAAALRDGENYLPENLADDNICHWKVSAYIRVAEYLLYHTVIT